MEGECVDYAEDEDREERADEGNAMAHLGEDVMSFCDCIPRDQLLEFTYVLTKFFLRSCPANRCRWNMGICVPPRVIGDRGRLKQRQSKIRNLHLLTNGSCSWDDFSDDSYLSEFMELREFSWRGLQKEDDLEAVVECLLANARWLEDLDLALCLRSSRRGATRNNRHHFIMSDLLELQPPLQAPLFSSLQHLALSLMSFGSMSEVAILAFNFSQLQSLKLWNCPGMFDLISRLTFTDGAPRLSLLELVATELEDDVEDVIEVVERFLKTSSALEDLYLMFSVGGAEAEIYRIAEAINAHQDSLRKLVLHLRTINLNGDSPRFELAQDSFINWSESYMNLLSCSKLHYMAGTFVPASLVRLPS